MAAGWLNTMAGPGGSAMPEDPVSEMMARRQLAKLLAGGAKDYTDASPKEHPMQVAAQTVQGIVAGLNTKQQLAAQMAASKASSAELMRAIGIPVVPGSTGEVAPGRAPGAAPSARSTSDASSDKANAVYAGLVQRGLDPKVAAAMAGNFRHESAFDNANSSGDDGTAFGLGQWRGDRFDKLKQLAASQGKPWSDLDVQLDHTVNELKGGDAGAAAALRNAMGAPDAGSAAIAIMNGFERPSRAAAAQSGPLRAASANQYFETFGKAPPVAAAEPVASGDQASVDPAQSGDLRAQLQAAFDAKRGGAEGPDAAFASLAGAPSDDAAATPLPPARPPELGGAGPAMPAGDAPGALPPRMPPAMVPMPDPTNPQGLPEPGPGDLRGQIRAAMDQSAAPKPPGADVAALFNPAPMGAPQAMGGAMPIAAGAPIADPPMPPARPSDVDLQAAAPPSPAMPVPRPRQQLAQAIAIPSAAPPAPQDRESLAKIVGSSQEAKGPYPTGPWGAASDGRGGLLNRLMDEPPAPAGGGSVPPSSVPQPTALATLPGRGAPGGGAPAGGPVVAPEAPALLGSAPTPAPPPGGAPAPAPAPQQMAQAPAPAEAAQGFTQNASAPTPRAAALLAYITKNSAYAADPGIKANLEVAQALYQQEVAPKTSTVDLGDSVAILDARGQTLRTIPKVKGADFGEIGRDAYGNPTYGYRNYADQTVKQPAIQGPGAAAAAAPLTDINGKPIPAGVDPKLLREQQTKGYAEAQAPVDPKQVAEVRKEVLGLPSYKNLAQASPIYRSMLRSADTDTKASDLNLIYGLGKIMDPGSVVREGELKLANDTQGFADRLIGMWNSVSGGARLTPASRSALIEEAYGRVQSYQDEFDFDTEHYRGIATRGRMNVEDVVPSYPKAGPYVSKANRDAQAADEKAEKAKPEAAAEGYATIDGVKIRRKAQ